MIICISYGDRKYKGAAELSLESAKAHGADRTILYGPQDIPVSFKLKYCRIFYGITRNGRRLRRRGAGYWVWKPYIIKKTLEQMQEGDILIYSDGASVYVNDISKLLDVFYQENLKVMPFTLPYIEKQYTKRDAFVLMNADSAEYTDTRQRLATHVVLQKCSEADAFVDEWLNYCLDYRIITDAKNKMKKDNYPEFVDHRHDQSVFSIVAKKWGIKEYRDPSQWGNKDSLWPEDVLKRSRYPQIWYSTRNPKIKTMQMFEEMIKDLFEKVE